MIKKLCISLALFGTFFYLSSLNAQEDLGKEDHLDEESSAEADEVDSEKDDEKSLAEYEEWLKENWIEPTEKAEQKDEDVDLDFLNAQEELASEEHPGEESSVVEGEVESEDDDEVSYTTREEWLIRTRLEPMEEALREDGDIDEEHIEILFQSMRKFIRSGELPSKIPPNVRIGRSLKVLEGLIPELFGTSKTWEDAEVATDVFSPVVVGLARYHKLSDAGVNKLSSTINQFIDLGTNSRYERDQVESSTYLYFFSLVLSYTEFLRKDLSLLEQDREELLQVRAKLLSTDPKKNTRQIDKFVSCVDSIHKKADKEFTNLFTRLTKALEKTVTSINKAQSIDNEELKQNKIDQAVRQNFVKEASGSKILHLVNKIRRRDCYIEVDVDLIKFNYQEFMGGKINE